MKIKLFFIKKSSNMDFHGKSNNVIITEKFPFSDEDFENKNMTICPHFPSISNRFENNLFVGMVATAIIIPPFEYQIPDVDREELKLCDFVMSNVKYADNKPTFYRPRKEEMPENAEEVVNKYGFKLFKFKTEDRTKYFCDNIHLNKEQALQKWNMGYPLVSFIEGSSENPKTYFPSETEDQKPNLFLIIVSNISNMDFERVSTLKPEEVKEFLTANGMDHYNNLVMLNKLLKEKPRFLERKYNGFLIHNKQNLRSLLLNPPPRFGENVSKWKALSKMVKMIRDHR